ncbi:Rid family detoxifying hydrolase [Pseudomonas guariconensis]|uniref:Rid family detoxifying hydrolase n=1 Tax=Pseudomonas guariconensis TaxID=1288410 RepID=UPI0018ABC9FD|nr:Rid family detoxifying hydrolase [Pseudomonas guariconensis]MBF8741907.1 RidA family protein [Pseudomonas guariconensis]MBF8750881.1 RidA family protein [Pseudomonas guariconensis]
MSRCIVKTDSAPAAIGPYSQAIKAGNTLYISGQIPLVPESMQLAEGISAQIQQVFDNLLCILDATDMQSSDIAKLNIYLTDLAHFGLVNDFMASHFTLPFPARAAIGVAALPRGALIEVDAIAVKAHAQ